MKTGFLSLSFLFACSLGLMLTVITGCSPKFDQFAYENINKLSTEVPAVMNLATKPYSESEAKVSAMQKLLMEAQSYTTTSKRNKDLTEAYKVLSTELVTPFVNRWKEKNTLDGEFVKQAVIQVTNSLNAIERAEKSKRK